MVLQLSSHSVSPTFRPQPRNRQLLTLPTRALTELYNLLWALERHFYHPRYHLNMASCPSLQTSCAYLTYFHPHCRQIWTFFLNSIAGSLHWPSCGFCFAHDSSKLASITTSRVTSSAWLRAPYVAFSPAQTSVQFSYQAWLS